LNRAEKLLPVQQLFFAFLPLTFGRFFIHTLKFLISLEIFFKKRLTRRLTSLIISSTCNFSNSGIKFLNNRINFSKGLPLMDQNKKSLKPFLVLWSGQAISLLGSQLVQFALIWWLTQKTGSATVLATASLMGLLPQVVLGPFVGVLVDRWNRRLTMLVADSLVALATVFLAYLFWIEVAAIWHVFLILFIRALAGAFHWPSMQASTSLMVPEEHLTRIQGLNQILNGGLNIISAPLGALLIGILPLQGILAIDVVTAALAIIILFFIRIPQPERLAEAAIVQTSFWQEMREGLQYVRGWRALMLMLGLSVGLNFLLNPAFSLLPLLVTKHFQGGAIQLGAMESALGIGVLLGGLTLGAWGGFKRRMVTALAALIAFGLSVFLIGITPATLFSLAVGGMFGVGMMMTLANGPIIAVMQAIVEPDKQGRVFSLIGSLSGAMSPLGLMIAGPVADAIGVRAWFVMAGVAMVLAGVVGFLTPALLNIENGRPTEAAAEIAATPEQLPAPPATTTATAG
jgi:MFS transporter, DHA3 family, macrolide efflux protein